MTNLIINDSISFPDGVKIPIEHLQEGIEYVKKHKSKEVCVWAFGDRTRKNISLDFLKDMKFIERFHFGINLSSKSSIEGLHSLRNLKELRWASDSPIDIDFSKLNQLKILIMPYQKNWKNLDSLQNLKGLYVDSIKEDDLTFLPELHNLRHLRMIRGNLVTLEGLEKCKNLEYLDLRALYKLEKVMETVLKLDKLKRLEISSCKRTDVDLDKLREKGIEVGFR